MEQILYLSLYGTLFLLLGFCVGSFLNVVIWRLPHLGREVLYLEKTGKLTLSWPPSHCPMCDKKIRWYQNIPLLAWLVLRGKCAGCKTRIPVRYPLVELGTGIIFAALFLAYFRFDNVSLTASPFKVGRVLLGHPILLHLFFISIVLSASAIDADWYIIPLVLPILVIIAAFIFTPAMQSRPDLLPYLDPAGPLAWPTMGACVGLVIANILLWLRIIPRSFEQYNEALAAEEKKKHEIKAEAKQGPKPEPKSAQAVAAAPAASSVPTPTAPGASAATIVASPAPAKPTAERMAPPPKTIRIWPSLTISILLILGAVVAWRYLKPEYAGPLALFAGILIFLIGVLPRQEDSPDVTDDVLAEINVPNARMEILKEAFFLAFPAVGAMIGVLVQQNEWFMPPIPYGRLLGVMFGFLVGGGLVWGTRILGTLGFGKEAMGLGDVHLMAAVGCILGAANVSIAFVIAPFFGLLWAAVLAVARKPNILPYGPWLSVSSMLCLLIGKPLALWYLQTFFPQQ